MDSISNTSVMNVCKFCSKKFSQKHSLKQHLYDAHRNVNFVGIEEYVEEINNSSSSSSSSNSSSLSSILYQQPFLNNNTNVPNTVDNPHILIIRKSNLREISSTCSDNNSSSTSSQEESDNSTLQRNLYNLYHGKNQRQSGEVVPENNGTSHTLGAVFSHDLTADSTGEISSSTCTENSSSTFSSSNSQEESDNSVLQRDHYNLYHGKNQQQSGEEVPGNNETSHTLGTDTSHDLTSDSTGEISSSTCTSSENSSSTSSQEESENSALQRDLYNLCHGKSHDDRLGTVSSPSSADSSDEENQVTDVSKTYRSSRENHQSSECNVTTMNGTVESTTSSQRTVVDDHGLQTKDLSSILTEMKAMDINCSSACSSSSGSDISSEGDEDNDDDDDDDSSNYSLESCSDTECRYIYDVTNHHQSPQKKGRSSSTPAAIIFNSDTLSQASSLGLLLDEMSKPVENSLITSSIKVSRNDKSSLLFLTEMNSSDDEFLASAVECFDEVKKKRSQPSKKFPCLVCGKLLPSILSASYHCNNRGKITTTEDKTSKQPRGSAVQAAAALADNRKKKFPCSKCGQILPSILSASYHCNPVVSAVSESSANNQQQQRRSKIFHCPVCAEPLPSIQSAQLHCSRRNEDAREPAGGAIELLDPPSSGKKNQEKIQKCQRCNTQFNSGILLQKHLRICNVDSLPDIPIKSNKSIQRFMVESCLSRHIQNIRFQSTSSQPLTFDEFYSDAEPLLRDTLHLLYKDKHFAKVAFSLFCTYFKEVDGIHEYQDYYHHINAESENDINLETVKEILERQISTFHVKGSGWILANIKFMDMNITTRFTISHHVGAGTLTKLPDQLKAKRAVLNIELSPRNENQCFKFSVLGALHSSEIGANKHRSTKYEVFEERYKWENISFPTTSEDVIRFQKQNQGIYINLFEYDIKKNVPKLLCPAKIPADKEEINGKIINIMAVPQENEESYHYVAILNLDRLLNTKSENMYYFWCDHCIQPFSKKSGLESFNKHRLQCFGRKINPISLPTENNNIVSFNELQKTQRLPYIAYCDIECYLEKQDNTKDILHKPYAFGILLCSQKDAVNNSLNETYRVFKGENCIEEGLEHIFNLSKKVYDWNNSYARVTKKLTEEEKQAFLHSNECMFCCKLFDNSKLKKCQDHDHVTGKYRGALCSACNFKMRLSRNTLPVFFHNLRNYDGHLIINALAKLREQNKWLDFGVIPQSSEKYVGIDCTLEVGKYKNKNGQERPITMSVNFKDSALFLPASLDSLVQQLDQDADLYYSKKLLCNQNQQEIDLIVKKGVFPYEYFNSPSRCQERSLPDIDTFYDNLNQKKCTDEEYEHALKAWRYFKCDTFEDYLLIYLKMDVHQLADVFERFRELGMSQDGLDPAHYLTIPGFSWSSALKMTKVNIQLLTDYEMHSFFQKGIKGGLTVINNHFAEINSPIYPTTYDETKDRHELLYVDANNLYGKALSMSLPVNNFKWLTEAEIELLSRDLISLDLENSSTGYVLEVDLSYPPDVQDKTEDFPFAPEAGIPAEDCLTDYMKELFEILHPDEKFHGCQKLMQTHGRKENYIVHGLLLQFYIKHGLLIEKIHNVISFNQQPIFKPYIEFNSAKRQNSNSSIEKDYFKLKNNSLFGKTMENVLRRINFKLATNNAMLRKYSTKPGFQRSIIFSESLAGIQLCQENILLNKPIFIGQAVLDISKLIMYKWRYEIFPQYEELCNATIRILGGDTDSFFLSVTGASVYDDLLPKMLENGHLDTSNYDKNHPLFSLKYKANLNCIKDESGGNAFKEFVLLKPKCYSMTYVSEKRNELKRAKGVRKVTLCKEVNYADYYNTYKRVVKNPALWQTRIASKKHQVSTLHFKKKILSVWEDKRAWISENRSLPYGNHKLLNKNLPKRINQPKKIIPQRKMVDITSDDEYDTDEDREIMPTSSKRRRIE